MKTPNPCEILEDPSASSWIKQALQTALDRNPVDAVNDASLLFRVLDAHLGPDGWKDVEIPD
jgi:hypothetical protein